MLSRLQQISKCVTIHALMYLALLGCQTVHTNADGEPTIAIWFSGSPENQKLVCDVLRDHGLHAVVDNKGVSVADAESQQAREVLLTDQRLKDSGVLLFEMVVAGTGRKTNDGIMARVIMPDDSAWPATAPQP